MACLAALGLLATACSGDDEAGPPVVPQMTQAQRATTTIPPNTGALPEGSIRIVLRLDDETPEGAMDTLVDIIRQRLGAAGALVGTDLRNDGERLEVVVPGVAAADQADLIRLVTSPGTLRLRPVLSYTINTGSAPPETSGSDPQATVELPSADGMLVYTVGPAGADGTIFEPDATAEIQNGAWGVTVGLRPGADGEDAWNALAAQCYSSTDTCPTQAGSATGRGQMAIEVDGLVLSAPTVNAPEFSGEVSISGSFGNDEAEQLAAFLRFGALPAVTVESVATD